MAGYDFVVYLSLLCSIVFLSLSIVSIFLCFPIVSYVVLFLICLPLCAPSLLIFQLVLTVLILMVSYHMVSHGFTSSSSWSHSFPCGTVFVLLSNCFAGLLHNIT